MKLGESLSQISDVCAQLDKSVSNERKKSLVHTCEGQGKTNKLFNVVKQRTMALATILSKSHHLITFLLPWFTHYIVFVFAGISVWETHKTTGGWFAALWGGQAKEHGWGLYIHLSIIHTHWNLFWEQFLCKNYSCPLLWVWSR